MSTENNELLVGIPEDTFITTGTYVVPDRKYARVWLNNSTNDGREYIGATHWYGLTIDGNRAIPCMHYSFTDFDSAEDHYIQQHGQIYYNISTYNNNSGIRYQAGNASSSTRTFKYINDSIYGVQYSNVTLARPRRHDMLNFINDPLPVHYSSYVDNTQNNYDIDFSIIPWDKPPEYIWVASGQTLDADVNYTVELYPISQAQQALRDADF
jgi:hypothetical protein